MTTRLLPTPAEVRAWENETGRGHTAAAEHFRAAGYPDVTKEEIADLYRRGGRATGKAPRAREEEAPRAATPADGQEAPRGVAAQPRAPETPLPPMQLPAVVPKPPPKAGTLEFYEHSLEQIDERLTRMPHKDGAAYAALVRQKHLVAEKIAELRAAEEAKSAQHLTPAQRIARLGEMVHKWPDMALEVAVAEYLERKGYQLFDPRVGRVIGPERTGRGEETG
jgi:hypothetical protein